MMQRHVLIVARSEAFHAVLAEGLRGRGFRVHAARTSGEIVQLVREMPLEAVLVESMRGSDAERFRGQVQRIRPDCLVLFVTGLDLARETGKLRLHGPSDFIVGGDDILSLLEELAPRRAPERAGPDHRIRSLIQSLDVVVSLLEADDPFFAGFSNRVAGLAAEVAAAMELDQDAIDEIAVAALLRDIGKAGVDRAILEETRIYDAPDMIRMQQHVEWSLRLLEHITFPWKILSLVRHHHERYDGAGYPDSLHGRQIPIGARILAATETWIAMVSDRPHRKAKDHDEARAELIAVAGSQLDPEVVETLLRVVEARAAAHGEEDPPLVAIDHVDAAYARLLRVRLINDGFDVTLVGEREPGARTSGNRVPSVLVCEIANDPDDAVMRLDRARAAIGSKPTPIAVLSSLDDRAMRMACLGLGIDDFIPKDNDLEEVVARIRNILLRDVRRRNPAETTTWDGIGGRLEAMAPADVAQFLALGGKTACLSLTGDGGAGAIWFESGRIVHATCDGARGVDALRLMLRWASGTFAIRHGATTSERTVDDDGTSLLREVMRITDEGAPAIEPVMDVFEGDVRA